MTPLIRSEHALNLEQLGQARRAGAEQERGVLIQLRKTLRLTSHSELLPC